MKINRLLTILFCVILLSSKVFACTLGSDSSYIQNKQIETYGFIAISCVLSALTIFLYFKKNNKGILSIIISLVVVTFTFLTSNANVGDCGHTAVDNAKAGVLISFICFSFQFFTWLFRRKSAKAELP